MNTNTVTPTRGFPRADAPTRAPQRVETPAIPMGVRPARGFPTADSQVREWIPGVTGPTGWYDPAAIAALADERVARTEKIISRIWTSTRIATFALSVSFLTWTWMNIVAPVAGL